MFRPNREFQAGLDIAEARRVRQNNSLSLRRKQREHALQNKRKKILNKARNTSSSTESNTDQKAQMNEHLSNLPRYVQGIQTGHKSTILECLKNMRVLLSFDSDSPPVKQVIDSGIVPTVIDFLQMDDSPEIQFEAMWVITNIVASSQSQYTSFVVRYNTLEKLYHILSSKNYALLEQAIWALGNIAGDNASLRDQVLNSEILNAILEICQTPFNEEFYCKDLGGQHNDDPAIAAQDQYICLLDTLSWALSNLCRGGKHTKEPLVILTKCSYFIIEFKKSIYDKVKLDAIDMNIAWTFSYLTSSIKPSMEECLMDCLCRYGALPELVKLVKCKGLKPCMKTIGNVLAGAECYTQICVDLDIIGALKSEFTRLLTKSRICEWTYLKELCWSLSNICAGPIEHVRLVQKQELFPIMMNLIKSAPNLCAKEAMWAVANATSVETNTNNVNSVIFYLVRNCGLLEAFCVFNKRFFYDVEYQTSLDKTLLVSLETIQNVLKVGDKRFCDEFEEYGGCDFLEYLQTEDKLSQELYNFAVSIIRDHFEGEAEENMDDNKVDISYHGNNTYGNQFGFGFAQNNNNNNINVTTHDTNPTTKFEF